MLIHLYFIKDDFTFGSFFFKVSLFLLPDRFIAATFVGLIFDLWFVFYIWGPMFLVLHINLGLMHTFKTAVLLMMQAPSKNCKVTSSKLLLEKHMLIYSMLRIITELYNNVFGPILVPGATSVMGAMIALSIFVCVRLAGKGGPLVALFGISGGFCVAGVLIVFVTFLAMVHDYSTKFWQWLRKNKDKSFRGTLGRRLVMSYKVVAVSSGGMYKIQRTTCLTVLGLVSNVSASVLIAIKI